MKKNIYFYTNFLAWALVLFLVGNYAFSWNHPSVPPPNDNLPAPINLSSTAQSKKGYLAIATSTAPSYPLDVAGSVNATTYYGDGSNLTGISAGLWTDGGTYIYANNATNVAVTDAGSVGIGTTGPTAKLSFGNYYINVPTPTADQQTSHIRLYDTGDGNINYGIGVSANALNIAANQNTGTIRLYTNSSERVRITSTGNVGIGDATPTYKLDVAGTGRFTGDLTVSGASTNFRNAVKAVDGSGSGIDADLLDGVSSGDFARWYGRIVTNLNSYATSPSGFYGVSGTAANAPEGSYQAMINARNLDVGFQLLGGYSTDDLWYRGWASSGATFYAWRRLWHDANDGSGSGLDADKLDGYHLSTTRNSANTVPVRNTSGYLDLGWINTTSGSCGTSVPIRIYGSHSGNYIRYYTPTNFATVMEPYFDDHFLSSHTNSNLTAAIIVPTANRDEGIFGTYVSTKTQHIWSMGTGYRNAANGSSFGNLYGLAYKYNGEAGGHGVYLVNNGVAKVGLGTNIWTSGTVKATGFFYSSDVTLKKNVQEIETPLAKIMKLDGISFNWKDSGKKSIGLIAQDVVKVFPEIINTDEETGLKTIEYAKLVAPLIEATKEQQKMIDEQRELINQQGEEIKTLKILFEQS